MEQKIQLSQVLHEQRRYSSAKCSKTKSRGGVGVGFKSGKNALPGGGGKGRKGGLHCNWKDKIRRLTHNGTSLQYSCLENPMDGGAWWAAVHGVAKSWIRLSDFTFPFHFHALEKEMATHSSVLAWRIPGTEEPGGLPSMGLHRVGHDWSDLAAAATYKVKIQSKIAKAAREFQEA